MSEEFEQSPYHCTPYVEDADNFTPCQCPVCGAFLAWDKTGEIPICNRCGAELAKVSKKETEWICCQCQTANSEASATCSKCGHEKCEKCGFHEDNCGGDGKICALSGAKHSLKGTIRISRQAKEGAKKWKGWL